MPEGARMKKAALITAIVLLFAMQSLSAVTSRFVLASSVVNRSQTNPAVILNIQATDVSAYVDTGIETSAITDLNLTEDGSITFALMTSAEVFISSGKLKSQMDIEVVAEGFHRYDYNKATATPTSNDDKYIIEENAVPLDTLTPAIDIPMFNGEDENCEVKHAGADNKVEVEFTQGVTRENLTLATFTVSWKGMSQLDVGIYKAKVSVIYSTP